MNDIRVLIQSKLNEIEGVDCGVPVPDSIVENGKTYFGYELQEVYVSGDCDSNYVMRIHLTGRIVRRDNAEEDTLFIIDEALSKIKQKLKELNFSYGYRDISLDNGIRKMEVSGEALYNELNIKTESA